MKDKTEVQHTPLPWRVGDAGRTVFGPPNENPSPKMIAPICCNKEDTAFIVRAVNAHEELLKNCKSAAIVLRHYGENAKGPGADNLLWQAEQLEKAIAKAEEKP